MATFFRSSAVLEEIFRCKWIIKFPRSLNEGHLRFLDFLKKVEIIEKTDAREHTTSILNDNSIRAIFFRRKV